MRERRIEELCRRVDSFLLDQEVELPEAIAVLKTLLALLERRLEDEMQPLDLFTLPQDIPTLGQVYADLVARALIDTHSIAKTAELIGVGRSTLFRHISEGLLDDSTYDPAALRHAFFAAGISVSPGGAERSRQRPILPPYRRSTAARASDSAEGVGPRYRADSA